MRKLFNLPKVKLSKQESTEIQTLILARIKYKNDRELLNITIDSFTSIISLRLSDFAFSHKLNLNRGYKLEGTYPDYYLVRERKLPFKKKVDTSIKDDNGQMRKELVES